MPGSDDEQKNSPLPPELTDEKIRELLAAGEGKRPERRPPSPAAALSARDPGAPLSDAQIKAMLAAGERKSRASASTPGSNADGLDGASTGRRAPEG